MTIPSNLIELFQKEEIFLPKEEYENLLKGKETNFVFVKQGDRKQAVKLKLNPNYLTVQNIELEKLLVVLKPTQQLFIPKNIQAKLDENPDLYRDLLKNKFTKANFSLGTDTVQDFYLRIHPYLNRVEAYPVNKVAVPAQLNKYQIEANKYSDLQGGSKLEFIYQNTAYSVQFDALNKRFKVHLSESFDSKSMPFAVNDSTCKANDIYQFIPFKDSENMFSIEITQSAIENYEKFNHRQLKVSDLAEYIEKNDFLKKIYPDLNLEKVNLFSDNAMFKVEKPTNQFENHYDVPISKRLFLAGTQKGNYLQNEAIYYAYKTQNAFDTEKRLEFSIKHDVNKDYAVKEKDFNIKR